MDNTGCPGWRSNGPVTRNMASRTLILSSSSFDLDTLSLLVPLVCTHTPLTTSKSLTHRQSAPSFGASLRIRISAKTINASVYLPSIKAAETLAVRLVSAVSMWATSHNRLCRDHSPEVLTPVVQACLKSYTAVLRDLHCLDLMTVGYLARVSSVSTVSSTSSSESTLSRLVGASDPDESGGVGAVVVPFRILSLDILVCAFRFLFFDTLELPIAESLYRDINGADHSMAGICENSVAMQNLYNANFDNKGRLCRIGLCFRGCSINTDDL